MNLKMNKKKTPSFLRAKDVYRHFYKEYINDQKEYESMSH